MAHDLQKVALFLLYLVVTKLWTLLGKSAWQNRVIAPNVVFQAAYVASMGILNGCKRPHVEKMSLLSLLLVDRLTFGIG